MNAPHKKSTYNTLFDTMGLHNQSQPLFCAMGKIQKSGQLQQKIFNKDPSVYRQKTMTDPYHYMTATVAI